MSMNFSVYKQAQRLPDVDFNKISEVLEDPDTFVWFSVKEPSTAELKRIQTQFQLHDLAIEDANTTHQRPKLEEYGDTLFMAVHCAKLKGEEIVHGQLHLFVARQFIVLIQHGASARYDAVQARCERCPELFVNGSGYALYSVLDQVVDQFLPMAVLHQKRLDELESDIFKTRLDTPLIESIYELKKEVASLHNLAAPIADICAELSRLHPEIVTKELKPYFRDVQDHVERIARITVMLREALSDAMQVNLAVVTVRQNEVVKRLAGWGAILAVPTMIFSMHGMNFQNMPQYEWTFGFPLTLAVTAYACRELYFKLKQSGWL